MLNLGVAPERVNISHAKDNGLGHAHGWWVCLGVGCVMFLPI